MKAINLFIAVSLCGTLFGSCGSNKQQTAEETMTDRIENFSVKVPESSIQIYEDSYSRPVAAIIDGMECMVAYSPSLHSIDIISLDSIPSFKQIKLEGEGPNGVNQVNGIFYFDGSFILKCSTGFCRIDHEGKMMSKWWMFDYLNEHDAQVMLENDLEHIHLSLETMGLDRVFFILDGIDTYRRELPKLQKVLFDHVSDYPFKTICLGSAEDIPVSYNQKNESVWLGFSYYRKLEVKAIHRNQKALLHRIVDIAAKIYATTQNASSERIVVTAQRYSVRKVDFRTILLLIRILMKLHQACNSTRCFKYVIRTPAHEKKVEFYDNMFHVRTQKSHLCNSSELRD